MRIFFGKWFCHFLFLLTALPKNTLTCRSQKEKRQNQRPFFRVRTKLTLCSLWLVKSENSSSKLPRRIPTLIASPKHKTEAVLLLSDIPRFCFENISSSPQAILSLWAIASASAIVVRPGITKNWSQLKKIWEKSYSNSGKKNLGPWFWVWWFNGDWARRFVESGLARCHAAYTRRFHTLFSPQFVSRTCARVCQERKDHAIVFQCTSFHLFPTPPSLSIWI